MCARSRRFSDAGVLEALALPAIIAIEIQAATLWRARRDGWGILGAEVGEAGVETTSFYWSYYVFIGVVAFVILYLL